MFAYVGEKTIGFFLYANRVATLAGYGAYRLTIGLPQINRVSWAVLKRQILFTGVEALPFAVRIGLLSSAIVMLLSVMLSQAKCSMFRPYGHPKKPINPLHVLAAAGLVAVPLPPRSRSSRTRSRGVGRRGWRCRGGCCRHQ